MADENDAPVLTDRPKKRKSVGRQRDLAKKARVSNHVLGEDYSCSRFQCFQGTTHEEGEALINAFNALESKDSQDSFLSSLIKVESVARRRPRPELEDRAKPKHRSYAFHIKVQREGVAKAVPVCLKRFCAMFGITHRRVRTIQTALKKTGEPKV
ncbi:vitamin B12-dependent ribonucleotide reductase [Elysia marginata]|uniref:Vitamin B12-dependent ribonucleotide reductase n=1 Tax=Elysia marginata TaxID=1093978 RepID=A0AAV4H5Z4_9GAST|nr:vitamin B12-dependent ribonucleotide reductase [Elysia marginata]